MARVVDGSHSVAFINEWNKQYLPLSAPLKLVLLIYRPRRDERPSGKYLVASVVLLWI